MKKYFDWQQAFHYIWNNADHDGIWNGNAATLADEFSVCENEAHFGLSELCHRRLIELVDERTYAVTKWPESHQHD